MTPDPKIASFLSNSNPEQSSQTCEAFKLLNLDLLFQMGCELHASPTEKKARLARSIWLQKEADELQQVLAQENIRFAFLKGTAFDARY